MPIDEPTQPTERNRLTRREVAAQLGVSLSAVRRREGAELHPIQDDKGVWRFDAAEVQRLKSVRRRRLRSKSSRRKPKLGDTAARVFRLFEQGQGMREIVLRVRQPPELVRKLYREWLTGLAEGERTRHQNESQQRQRRELLEDERMQIEQLRILCR